MHFVELTYPDLAGRARAVRELVKPLLISPTTRTSRTTVACQQVPSAQKFILATHDGSRPNSEYRDWRFSTYKRDFRCMYFEVWTPESPSKEIWWLEKAYFSLYRTLPATRRELEVLAIHCDPLEDDGERHARYKQGPHLHVSAATDPIPHAHFLLNHRFLPQVMENITELSAAVSEALLMVKDQVIDIEWPAAA